MNIFEKASRVSLRFETGKGLITVEQLWGLPLKSDTGKVCLDGVARTVNNTLKDVSEESFVDDSSNPRTEYLKLALEVVKHVIAVRLQERDDASKARDRAERRRKLADALAAKENEEMSSMSKEDILKELEALG